MLDAAFGDQHADALGREPLQGVHQLIVGFGRHRHPEDSGELPGHPRQTAFQPVATVGGDALGNAFDLAGLVRSEYRENQMVHGAALFLGVEEQL